MRIPDGLTSKGISIEATATPEGRQYSFKIDGAPCKVALNTNNSARIVAGFQAMLADVYKIKSYLDLACKILDKRPTNLAINKFDAEDDELLICSSLYHSAVSLYGKCFKKADGRKVKLDEGSFKAKLSHDLVIIHDRFHSLRDNWTGHGGDSDHEDVAPVVLFQGENALPTYLTISTALNTTDEMRKLLLLCEPMIELINSLKEKNEKKVFRDDPMPLLKQLKAQAKNSLVIPTRF